MSADSPGRPVEYRGGNSRQLARALDGLESPLAVLDRKGQLVFVNSSLCRMVQADATQLVGKQTSWEVASDDTPFSALLTALAPPESARSGKIATRQLTSPVVFGSEATGQLFIPLLDDENLVASTIVILGDEQFGHQIPKNRTTTRPEASRAIVSARSTWANMDALHSLLGESPAIRLAMSRAQLAMETEASLFVHGPPCVGKSSVIKGVFSGRLKRLGLPLVQGQYFPVDCHILDAKLIDGMMEVFAGRLRPEAKAASQLLHLEQAEQLTEPGIKSVLNWLARAPSEYCVAISSKASPQELASRGKLWAEFVAKLSVAEIYIPPLADRREDIPTLALQALSVACRKADRVLLAIAPDTLDLLLAYHWPSNLEQLNSAIEKSVGMAVLTNSLQPTHLPVEIRTFAGSAPQQDESFDPIQLDNVLIDLERVILRRAMKLSPRNRAQVARWLNISRPRLLRRIEQLGLDDKQSAGNENDEAS